LHFNGNRKAQLRILVTFLNFTERNPYRTGAGGNLPLPEDESKGPPSPTAGEAYKQEAASTRFFEHLFAMIAMKEIAINRFDRDPSAAKWTFWNIGIDSLFFFVFLLPHKHLPRR